MSEQCIHITQPIVTNRILSNFTELFHENVGNSVRSDSFDISENCAFWKQRDGLSERLLLRWRPNDSQ